MSKPDDPRPAAIRNLQRQMIAAGFSQTSLAARLGVKPAAVNHWIRGRALPAPDKFLALKQLVDLSN